MGIKSYLIALALILSPMLAKAQAFDDGQGYYDDGVNGAGGTRCTFTLYPGVDGALISGGLSVDSDGTVTIPGKVMDSFIQSDITTDESLKESLLSISAKLNISLDSLLDSGIPVIGIDDMAFMDDTTIKHVDFSQVYGMAYVRESAFENCSGLTGPLNLPSGLINIGSAAFYNC